MEEQGMVFGVDIATPFLEWVRNVFTPRFKAVHPNDEFAGFIVEPSSRFNPYKTSLSAVLMYSTTDDIDTYMDLLQNVRHKGQFSLRTGMDSSMARGNTHLVLPGDFVYDGFLFYRGLPTGGSGVRKEFDVVYVREIADEYIRLRSAVVDEVISLIDWAWDNWDGELGAWKYLNGTQEQLVAIRMAYNRAHAT